MKRRNALFKVGGGLVGIAAGCRWQGPTGLSKSGVPSNWSPFIGVHAYLWDQNIQQPYLLPLIQNRTVQGVRLGPYEEPARWFRSQGVDVLGISPNELLRDPNPELRFADVVSQCPSIQQWEIGNEVGLFIAMPPDEYVPIFMKIHRYAREKNLGVIVIPEAPMGTATGPYRGGDDTIKRYLDLGLLDLMRRGELPVFAIHYYSDKSVYIPTVKKQIERIRASAEIWVTEVGVQGSIESHPDFVHREYQRVKDLCSATRSYWYVLSECGKEGYSLIEGLPPVCRLDPPILTDLYLRLRGALPGGGL